MDTGPGRRWSPYLAALALASLWLVAAGATLTRHGATYDEVSAEFFFGERYLECLQRRDLPQALDFTRPLPEGRGPSHPEFFASSALWRGTPEAVFPVGAVLSALTCRLFHGTLGAWEPVDAHHVAPVLAAAVLLAAVFLFTDRYYGRLAALGAAVALILHPRFNGETFNNVKDVPETVLFSLTVMAFARGIEGGRPAFVLLAGALGGLALGAKANALFLPLLLLPWAVVVWLRRREPVPARLLLAALLAPLLAGAVFVGTWPWLWPDLTDRLLRFLGQLVHSGYRAGTGWTPTPALEALATAPPLTLLFAAAGLALAPRDGARLPLGRGLLLAWLALPVARVSVPGAQNFDVIRHFLEYVPALALLCGIGLASAARLALGRLAPVPRAAVALAVLAVPALASIARYHPYQAVYYNAFVGGLAGARERGFSNPTDYWGRSVREGLAWVRAHAPPRAQLYSPVGGNIVEATRPWWLRPDVELVQGPPAPEREALVLFFLRPEFYDLVARYCLESLAPAHTVKAAGAPLLHVFHPRGADRERLDAWLAAIARGFQWIAGQAPGAGVLFPYPDEASVLGPIALQAGLRVGADPSAAGGGRVFAVVAPLRRREAGLEARLESVPLVHSEPAGEGLALRVYGKRDDGGR
jgi:hypothetical protein